MGENQEYLYEFDGYRLDPVEQRLLRAGHVIPLTPKVFETLRLLVENSGRLLEKDRLMEMLWADAFVEEGNLADNISKIRQALGDSRKDPKFIETVSGRGYRFIAEVRKVEVEPAESKVAAESPRPAPPEVADPGSSAVYAPSRRNPKRFLLGVLGLVAAGGLLFYVWNSQRPQLRQSSATIKSIAVLPFKPIVAANRDEALELGMSDTLISALSRLKQLTVRPTSSIRRFTSLEQDAVAAGREVGVESVLDGNIQRSDDRIRMTVRLMRVENGETLWSETFDEKFTDIFTVHDSISKKIVNALALQVSGAEQEQLTKKYTSNTEAYQLYLRGRFFWSKLTLEGLQKSLDFYSQAIAIDPGYALAYAGLADSYNLLGSYGFSPLDDSHPKARSAAENALRLDPDLAEAHTSLAAVLDDYYWDWGAAETHFRRAIALNPNYPVAHYWYSQHLSRMGRVDEAVDEARLAQTLDPLSASTDSHLGLALYRARRFDEAAAVLRQALEFNPEALDAHIFLGFVYVQQGKKDEAIEEFQSAVEISEQNPGMRALLGYGYASAGRRDEAIGILREFDSAAGERPVSGIETAMIYIALGEHDRVFEWLEKAYAERAWQLGFLKVEPIFDPLRGDPRFADLIRRVNLAP